MTFQPGQSGNPTGKRRTPWADALRSALAVEDPKFQKKRLELIADKVISEAMAGDMVAIKEIGDRMDGKPAQAIVGDADQPITLTITWAKEEALALPAPKDELSPSELNEASRKIMVEERAKDGAD